MDETEITQKLREMSYRLEELQSSRSGISPGTFLETLEELSVSLEELQVAQQELAHFVTTSQEIQRYKDLFYSAPDGYVITDTAGIILEVNRAAAALLGRDQAYLLGKPLASYVILQDRREFRDHLAALNREPTPFTAGLRMRLRPKHGSALVVAARATPAFDKDNTLTGFRWILRDITERAKTEGSLQRYAIRLETLHEIDQALLAEAPAAEIAYKALSHLCRLVPCRWGYLLLMHEDGRSPILLAVETDAEGEQEAVGRITSELRAWISAVAQIVAEMPSGQMLLENDLQHPAAAVPLPKLPSPGRIHALLGFSLAIQDTPLGSMLLLHHAPGAFTAEAVEIAREITSQITVAIQQERLGNQAARRLKELAAIYEASQRLQQLRRPEALAQEIIHVLEKTLGYDYGLVLLLDESGQALVPFALSDQGYGPEFREQDKAYLVSKGLKIGVGITGWVAQTGTSLRTDDVTQDPRYFPTRADIRSELCVPLWAGDRVIGVVNVETSQPNAYTESDQRVLETVAAHISTAIQNARLLEEVTIGRERLATLSQRLVEVQEAERRFVARELHDEVGQVLTGLKLTLGMGIQESNGQARMVLTDAEDLVDELMGRVRDMSLDLRPAMLDDLGLLAALLWYFERYTSRTQIRVDFKHRGLNHRLDSKVETAAFRMVQEALTNVARHASVDEVAVTLCAAQQTLQIEIEDRGKGFDPAKVELSGSSSGLPGMRERINLLGGELAIASHPGAGTRLTGRLPLGSA
ncbi:MAG: GAF domain-containing protein [Chloroflexi bacterium]|nr:GAF domain-containing protein [Chloroflexota bacterium]